MTTDIIETVIPTSGGPSVQFSAREVPWMKLGKLVDSPLTAAEAIKQGGLDFTVAKRKAAFLDEDGTVHAIKNRAVVVREDTNIPLGIMSAEYPLLQYSEAFDFMDAVNPEYVAAGALQGGKQGFLVVRAPEHTIDVLNGQDKHDLFVILRTSHDGSRAVEATIQALRDRCMNQLTLSSFGANAQYRWSIKHTSTMHDKLIQAQAAITALDAYGAEFTKLVDRLAHTTVSEEAAIKVLTSVLPNRPRRPEQIDEIIASWHTSETVGFDGTAWGVVNAVSEYFDWGRAGGNPESRFTGALQGATFKAVNATTRALLQLAA